MTETSSKIKKPATKTAKASYLKVSSVLLIIGGAILLTTPLISKLLVFMLTRDCPVLYGKIECGLNKGLHNADIIIASLALWVFTGIIFLLVGLLEYRNTKKKS